MGTDSTTTTATAEVVTTSKAPSNHVTAPDHVPALASQSHVSFARNRTVVPGITRRRNRRRKRLDLGPGISIDSKIPIPVTSTRALIVLIYSISPKSKVNQTKAAKVVKTKMIWAVLLVLLQPYWRILTILKRLGPVGSRQLRAS